MTISTINSVASTQSTASVSKAVPFEWNRVAQPQPQPSSDTVTLSPEAIAAQRQEQYALKTDPIELFNEWLEKDLPYGEMTLGSGTKDTLLPENQPLMNSLQHQVSQAKTKEQKEVINADIQTLTTFGNQEIFTERAEIERRMQAVTQSDFLQKTYLTEKYGSPEGKLPEDFLQRAQQASDYLKSLWTNRKDGGDAVWIEEQTQFQPAGINLENFKDRDFLSNLLAHSSYQNSAFMQDEVINRRNNVKE